MLPIEASAEVVLQERLLNKILTRYCQLHSSFKPHCQKQKAMLRVEEEEQGLDAKFVKELLLHKEAKKELEDTISLAKKGKKIGLQQYLFLCGMLLQ